MHRRAPALLCLLALACVAAALPARGATARAPWPASPFVALSPGSAKPAPAAPGAAPATYVVQLDAPPAPPAAGRPAPRARLRDLDAAQRQVLAELERAAGARVEPTHTYRYALAGFAAALTPRQAAVLAALPGVRRVERDELLALDSDTGPAFIGAAQPDQRPALFHADLAPAQGAPAGAAGRALASYDAATRTLSFRVSFAGLSGAPTAAHLHLGAAGGAVLDLADALAGAPAASGALAGSKTLVDVGGAAGKTAAEVEAALLAGGLSIDIHTAASPGGEVGGPLAPARGEGMIIGVIDSGVNIANPSFADVGGDGYDHANPLGRRLGVCDPASARFDGAFPCNDKVIGAYTFSDTAERRDPFLSPSPHDDSGHGSHTASTAAGNVLPDSSIYGAGTGPISGVAPHANLIIYDVCGIEVAGRVAAGCPLSAIIAAVDQAAADGVDVLNRSISASGDDPWFSSDALTALSAFAAGVVPVGSAGNQGPGAATLVGAVHSAPWTIAVGASTHSRVFVNRLAGFTGGSAGARPPGALTGRGMTAGAGPAELIYAGDIGNAQCVGLSPSQRAMLAGKIVVCDRAEGDALALATGVKLAGAVGLVLANDEAAGAALAADAFALPGVNLSYADGLALKAWLAGCGGCAATISGIVPDRSPANGDIMAGFSSRGPGGLEGGGPNAVVGDVLKPDVTAPGVAILAAGVNASPADADYALLSGTSMAAPHVAGAVALLRQLHPDWTPAEVKSALVTTGVTALRDDDGAGPATPFDRGGGRVSLGRAAFAGLVLDVTAAELRAADPFRGGRPAELNLPSFAEDACIGTCTFTRTLRSALGVPSTWSAAGGGDGVSVAVEPASLVIGPGATAVITVSADVSAAPLGRHRFGQVTLTPLGALAPPAALPLAVKGAASDLPPRISVVARAPRGVATQPVRAIAVSGLTAEVYGLVRTTPERVALPADPSPESPYDGAGGVALRPVTLPAGTTRFHVRTAGSSAPDLDLYVFLDGLLVADGVPQPQELICLSAGASSEEWCDLSQPGGAPLLAPAPLLVLVQNYRGSGAAADSFQLFTGTVGEAAAGNLTAGGPATSPSGAVFDLALRYDLGAADEGDRFVGLIRLGAAPDSPGSLGYSLVDITYDRFKQFLPLSRR